MTDGAIDNDFDDAQTDYDDQLAAALEGVRTEVIPGSVALDLVTRQLLFIRREVAPTCREYYDENNFDLVTYKMHPYLPGVDAENTVYECVFLSTDAGQAHKPGKTYDYPEGRLLPLPSELAWEDAEVGSL